MSCTKTGAQIYIEPYCEFAWCDAFETNGVAYFRIVQRSRKPLDHGLGQIYYSVHDYDQWFNKTNGTSTMIANNHTRYKDEEARKAAFSLINSRGA